MIGCPVYQGEYAFFSSDAERKCSFPDKDESMTGDLTELIKLVSGSDLS